MEINQFHKDRLFRAIFGYEKYKENFIPNGFHCGAKEDYLYKLANIIE